MRNRVCEALLPEQKEKLGAQSLPPRMTLSLLEQEAQAGVCPGPGGGRHQGSPQPGALRTGARLGRAFSSGFSPALQEGHPEEPEAEEQVHEQQPQQQEEY